MSKYIPKQFSPRIYPEWGELIGDLPVEKQSEIFMAILKYPTENPSGGVWKFIKSQIDKDYEDFIQRANKNKEIVKNYWKSKKETNDIEGKRTLTNDNEGKPITDNINKEHIINNIYKKIKLKKGQFLIDYNFRIKDIPDYEIYLKEVGDEVINDVQGWLIEKKNGEVVDHEFISRQIINFSKRKGLI